jgi:hypothetical protein
LKFFTREWTNGALPAEQAAAVPGAYWSYVANLGLPPTAAALSYVNPHDAYVLAVEHESARACLTLRLRCGDLQRGYWDVHITFSGVTVRPNVLRILRRATRPSKFEVLYDEVDRADDQFEYRFTLAPEGEVSILFQAVQVTMSAVASREAE